MDRKHLRCGTGPTTLRPWRYEGMRISRGLFVILLLGLTVPTASWCQETTWVVRQSGHGWIGVRFQYQVTLLEGRERTVAVVEEVMEDSPAQEAGLQAGDTLIHLDGQPVSPEVFASMGRTLEPGDLIRIEILRDGRPRELLVEARKPPRNLIISPDAERVRVELEALSGTILRDLDSLRLSFVASGSDTSRGDLQVHLLRMPRGSREETRVGFTFHVQERFPDTLAFTTPGEWMGPDWAIPFGAVVAEFGATDVLRDDLARLRRELTRVRREELSRPRELAAAVQGPLQEILQKDQRIQELRTREAELLAQQERLLERLQNVTEEAAHRQWQELQAQQEEAMERARRRQWESVEETRRSWEEGGDRSRLFREYEPTEFTSPVIVGQSFVLGAQLSPLNPQLASYLPGVEEGVLVVGVMDHTPAADAGLQGGDVIVSVGERPVTSLGDFRTGVSVVSRGPLRIRVVRKGEPVEITIRK